MVMSRFVFGNSKVPEFQKKVEQEVSAFAMDLQPDSENLLQGSSSGSGSPSSGG